MVQLLNLLLKEPQMSRVIHETLSKERSARLVSYPVCLEDEVEDEERHDSKHRTHQRCLECGLEVCVGVGARIHPACQCRVFL